MLFWVPGTDQIVNNITFIPPQVGDGWCNDLTNTPECDYDNGDCCGHDVNKIYCNNCECIQGNTAFTRKYAGETFTDLVGECIETNPEIDLNYVMSKFDPNVLIHVSVLKDGKVIQDIRLHQTLHNRQTIGHGSQFSTLNVGTATILT